MKKIIFVLGFLFFVLPMTSFAATVQNGYAVTIANPIPENAYISGDAISVESNIIGDLVSAAGYLNIENDVFGGVIAAATAIDISSNIKGSARLAGSTVKISGNVNGDVFVLAGNVDITKNATIGGDLIVYAGNVKIDGIVHGNLQGDIGILRITGIIGKNVNIKTGKFANVSETAKINGDFIYTSSSIAYIPKTSVVGEIKRNEIAGDWHNKGLFGLVTFGYLFAKLIGFLMMAIIGLLIAIFVPTEFLKVALLIKHSFWKYLGIGFLALIVIPISCIILLCTIIGAPFGLIVGAAFSIMAYVSTIFAGYFIGNLILRGETHNKWKIWGKALLGLLIMSIVCLIPFLGWLAVFVAWLVGFGAFIARRWEMVKFLREKRFW